MLTDLDETNRLRILSETLPAAVQAILANEAVTIAAHPAVCVCVCSQVERTVLKGEGDQDQFTTRPCISHTVLA